MEAYQVQQALRYDEIATQAWWNQQVKATKGKGNNIQPYFKNVVDLYDGAAQIDKVRAAYEDDYKPRSKAKAEKDKLTDFATRMDEFHKKYTKLYKNGKRKEAKK